MAAEVAELLLHQLRSCPAARNVSSGRPYVLVVMFYYARQHICYSAYMLSPVRLSVRSSVRRVYHRKGLKLGL